MSAADGSAGLEKLVARGLEAACDGPVVYPEAPGDPRLYWEMRVSLLEREGGGAETDGGARIERAGSCGGDPRAARFAVGVGPAALRRLATRALVEFDAPDLEWDAAREELTRRARRLRREAQGLLRAAAGEHGLTPRMTGHTAVDVRLRLRGWWDGDAAPRVSLEQGLRVALREPGRGLVAGEAAGRDAESLLPELRRLAARLASPHREPAGPAAPTRVGSRWCGPAVLLPEAAGWWVHEMAHAGLEGVVAREQRSSGRAALVDSPEDAPWPCGFAVDDAGAPARRVELWGANAGEIHPTLNRRRPSIRESALPSLSFSFLESARRGERLDSLPEGTPVIRSVRAGRLDPLTGVVLLHADRLGETLGGSWRPVQGEGVVIVGAVQGWRGLYMVNTESDRHRASALCTRQGRMNAVMVGAPTIVLDPVRIELT